jgi:hypothetical protein
MDRFRIYVPNYSDTKYEYTVTMHTWCSMKDDYFLIGYADDYIDDVCVDGLVWQDWMWDMGEYDAIYAWGDGFMYPLGWQNGWHNITFTFGEIWLAGLLDFQYISKTQQPDRIGLPKFWTKVSATEASPYLKIYESKAWTGSKWLSTPGTSMRTITTTVQVLANTTDTNTFYPAPQEAQVSLTLYNLSTLYPTWSYQDIGVVVNLTYTYFIDGSVTYGMPIWFYPYNVEVKLAEQDYMLYMPTPSLVFYNQTQTSFISTEWKVVLAFASTALGKLMGQILGGGIVGWIAGSAIGIYTGYHINQQISMAEGQVLNWTQEYMGPPTSRNFTMNAFKTTKDQVPLSPVVGSVCSAFVFHILPIESNHCGLISINLKGYLYLPFFYKNPETEYGTWLPIKIEIHTMFPVFTQ